MSQNQLMQDCPKGNNFNEPGSSFSSPVVVIRNGICSHSGWLCDDNSCEFYNELKNKVNVVTNIIDEQSIALKSSL